MLPAVPDIVNANGAEAETEAAGASGKTTSMVSNDPSGTVLTLGLHSGAFRDLRLKNPVFPSDQSPERRISPDFFTEVDRVSMDHPAGSIAFSVTLPLSNFVNSVAWMIKEPRASTGTNRYRDEDFHILQQQGR